VPDKAIGLYVMAVFLLFDSIGLVYSFEDVSTAFFGKYNPHILIIPNIIDLLVYKYYTLLNPSYKPAIRPATYSG
jgi:hypothetical protein